METVYILQIVTICITACTVFLNVIMTMVTNKQKNYNEVITNSRIEFMTRNRESAANFAAEAKSLAFALKLGRDKIDVKPLYAHFERIRIALRPYYAFDGEIIASGDDVIRLIEQAVLCGTANEEIYAAIEKFERLINIYDDADWKFIKTQFNSTSKKSCDFDDICAEIKSKYENKN